jgi:translocation and assembly module TamB
MNLAKARLGGKIVLSGNAARPGIAGTLRVLDGDVFYLDRRFEIGSGEIRFPEPKVLNPFFSIAATTEVVAIVPNSVTEIPGTQTYTVTLNVNGSLDRPHVVLTSQPLLSESDIVGVLTLGTSLGAVDTELAQRVQELAAHQLLGLGARRLERLLGIDDIRVTAAPFGAQRERRTHLTLTKKLTRRLTVSYGTAIRAFEEREITAAFRLATFLYLVGSTGWKVPSSIDLKARLTW